MQGEKRENILCTFMLTFFSARICASIEVNNTKLQGSLPSLPYPGSLIVPCTDEYSTSDGGSYYEATCSITGTWTLTDDCAYQGICKNKETVSMPVVTSEL